MECLFLSINIESLCVSYFLLQSIKGYGIIIILYLYQIRHISQIIPNITI